MKSVIISSSFIIVIIIISIFSFWYINKSSNFILDDLNEIYVLVQSDKKIEAKEKFIKMNEKIEKYKIIISIFENHTEMDNINLSLSSIKSLIEDGEKAELLENISNLQMYIKHIPQRNELNLENIL